MPTYSEALKFATREPKEARRPRLCPICGTPLKGRQRTACSNRCHVALHRKHRREGKIGPQTPLPITPVDDASRECRDALRKLAGGSGDSRDGDADL